MRSFVTDGYVYIRQQSDSYIVSRTGEGQDGYSIPKETDPDCKYSYREAKKYWDNNPDKRYEYTPPEPTSDEILRDEVIRLKQYLADTDWAVIKCFDCGLNFAEEYPELYAARQQARVRINEIEN